MMTASSEPRAKIDRLGAKLYVLWAGLSIGVAFLATPAKFLAPSLSLPVALDVGRQTFRVYNGVELTLLGALLVLGAWSSLRGRWYLGLAVPGAVVISQALWLIPALDLRVAAIQAGQSPLPPSNLHTAYIVAEAIKILWLLAMGLAEISSGWGRAPDLVVAPSSAARCKHEDGHETVQIADAAGQHGL